MEKKFTVTLTQEMVDYVQRLGYEVDAKSNLIDRMFEIHKNDDDSSMFDSVPFKKYEEEYTKVYAEYQEAVKELGKKIQPIVDEKMGKENTAFTFLINDFSSLEAEITIVEE